MPNAEQRANLRQLQEELRNRPDVGPLEQPWVGVGYFCGRERVWLLDTNTLEMARELAVRSDRRCRPFLRIFGIPIGPTRRDPIADHYGIDDDQALRMIATDFMTLPDREHGGRGVWLERQLRLIDEFIGEPEAPHPVATHRDDPVELEVTPREPTAPALHDHEAAATR